MCYFIGAGQTLIMCGSNLDIFLPCAGQTFTLCGSDLAITVANLWKTLPQNRQCGSDLNTNVGQTLI